MKIQEILTKISNKNVVVIGDIMLDAYLYGSVNRISPEAPVPILNYKSEEYRLGGAANVAANIRALSDKSNIYLLGLVGMDDGNDRITSFLKERAIHNLLIASEEHATTIKKRIIANGAQIARIDYHDKIVPDEEMIEQSMKNVFDVFDENVIDAIVLSDYGKGTFFSKHISKFLRSSLYSDVPRYLDTKSKYNCDSTVYGNRIDLITPNVKELKMLADCSEDSVAIPNLATTLHNRYHYPRILVTAGERGMILFDSNISEIVSAQAVATHVFDVSGAGDTVLAAMMLADLTDIPTKAKLEFAAACASCVISEQGTTVISLPTLIERFKDKEF